MLDVRKIKEGKSSLFHPVSKDQCPVWVFCEVLFLGRSLRIHGENHIHLTAMEEVISNFGIIALSGVPE